MRSSELYIHGSWKGQLFQLSINPGDTAQELNENHMQEKLRREQEEVSKRQRGAGGDRDTGKADLQQRNQAAERKSDLRGFCCLYSNKLNHMCIRMCACMDVRMREGTQRHRAASQASKGSMPTDRCMFLCDGVSPMIGGDGLFSFNSKLAVLVSEPDMQIKKVRHAHLILVNLPLHISPACQPLCDSNHHTRMPLLCALLPPNPLHAQL